MAFDGLTTDFCLFSALEIGGFAVIRSEVPYAICCDQWGERVLAKPELQPEMECVQSEGKIYVIV